MGDASIFVNKVQELFPSDDVRTVEAAASLKAAEENLLFLNREYDHLKEEKERLEKELAEKSAQHGNANNAMYRVLEQKESAQYRVAVLKKEKELLDKNGGKKGLIELLSKKMEFTETEALLHYMDMVVIPTISIKKEKDSATILFSTTEHVIEHPSGDTWGMFCARDVKIVISESRYSTSATMDAKPRYASTNIIQGLQIAEGRGAPEAQVFTHPHIQVSGVCCMGNLQPMLLAAHKKGNYSEIILLACKFLCSYSKETTPYVDIQQFVNPAQKVSTSTSPWTVGWCSACKDCVSNDCVAHGGKPMPPAAVVTADDLLSLCPSCGVKAPTNMKKTGWCPACANAFLQFEFSALRSESMLRGFQLR